MCKKMHRFSCGHHKYYNYNENNNNCLCDGIIQGIRNMQGNCPGCSGGTPSTTSSESSAGSR